MMYLCRAVLCVATLAASVLEGGAAAQTFSDDHDFDLSTPGSSVTAASAVSVPLPVFVPPSFGPTGIVILVGFTPSWPPRRIPARILAKELPPPQVYNVAPSAWQAPYVPWIGDQSPPNKLDDTIDASTNPSELFEVIINFRSAPTATDVSGLLSLSPAAGVLYEMKHLPSIAATGLTKAQLLAYSASDNVAFIERMYGIVPSSSTTDVAIAALQITNGQSSSSTHEQHYPDLDGSGVRIAVLDSGVDDDVHEAFFGNESVGYKYVDGYDAVDGCGTDSSCNPEDSDPIIGHGTFVASIALGRTEDDSFRGVAPGAGLIDVRVFNSVSLVDCLPPNGAAKSWKDAVEGLERVYDMRHEWEVDVINLSMAQCNPYGLTSEPQQIVPSNGLDSFSQLVNLSASMGIVVVAAAGNHGPTNTAIATPGAADGAITVAGSHHLGSDDPSGSVSWIGTLEGSAHGPRTNDCDKCDFDELKPDLTAYAANLVGAAGKIKAGNLEADPATTYLSDSGTSLATAMVSGVVALILQKAEQKGMHDPSKGLRFPPESIRSILQASASPRGDLTVPTYYPKWDEVWGAGLVDAYEAIRLIDEDVYKTDLSFKVSDPDVSWLTPSIWTVPENPAPGESARIYATIENKGSQPAQDVRVIFSVSEFGSIPDFEVGVDLVNVPAGGEVTAEVDWVPLATVHQSLGVEIAFAQDSDYSNNRATKKLIRSQDPAAAFRVANMQTSGPAQIYIDLFCEDANGNIYSCDEFTTWGVTASHQSVTLSGTDAPVEVVVQAVAPSDADHGDRLLVHAAMRIGSKLVDGVTIEFTYRDCNGNGVHDAIDVADPDVPDVNIDGIPDSCQVVCGNYEYAAGYGNTNRLWLTGEGITTLNDGLLKVKCSFAPPSSVVLLTMSGYPGLQLYKGGYLLVDLGSLIVFQSPAVADECGEAYFEFPVSNISTLPSVYMQAEALDIFAPEGSWLSNGLWVKFCPSQT